TGKDNVELILSGMVAYSWGIGSVINQIQTQVRRLFQLNSSTTFGYISNTGFGKLFVRRITLSNCTGLIGRSVE
ncbi:MAG TPA: hypothetical protein VGN12_04550, partial [Pirellulales bacterium]